MPPATHHAVRRFRPPRTWRSWLTLAIAAVLAARVGYLRVTDDPPRNLPETTYQVAYVSDGDTLKLTDGSRVRLLGIDTPEISDEGRPAEPWGKEATEFTKRFITDAHNQVRLQFDDERLDQYGRHLAYVWHDDKLLNEELIRAGLAEFKPHFRYSATMKRRFRLAAEEAKRNGVGIWSK